MLKWGVISNPFTRFIRQNPDAIGQLSYAIGYEGSFELTQSLEHLEAVCQEFSERKIEMVGVLGGDGTLGLVLSYLEKAYRNKPLPKILVLPGGTINFLAKNLGVSKPPLVLIEKAMAYLRKDTRFFEKSLKLLRVNGRVGFVYASGITSHILKEFYKNKTNSTGVVLLCSKIFVDGLCLSRLTGEFKKLMSYTEPMTIEYTFRHEPKQVYQGNYTIFLASVVPRLPLGVFHFRQLVWGGEEGEMFASTAVGGTFLKTLVRSVLKFKIEREFTLQKLFGELTLRCSRGAVYSLDGDLLQAEDGNIYIQPGPRFVFCSPYSLK
jgi:Diacylglycerol kinase catalytic domain